MSEELELLTYEVICPGVGYIQSRDDLGAARGEEEPCDSYAYRESWRLHPSSRWEQRTENFTCVGKLARSEFSRTSCDVKPHRVEASADSPARALCHTISEHGWSLHDALGGRGPSPPDVMHRFQCELCGEASLRDQAKNAELEAELRAQDLQREQEWKKTNEVQQKRKRLEKEEAQKRRLALLSSPPHVTTTTTCRSAQAPAGGSGTQADEDVRRFNLLKIAELKRVCAVNQLLVSGSKPQLVERLLGCKMHGRLGSRCPRCGNSKLELLYAPDSHEEPHAVQCKHMKGRGRPCSFRREFTTATKASVLRGWLVDSADGDLHRVGMVVP